MKVFSLSLVLMVLSFNASAAEVPGFDKPISMAAREQPVNDFFAELFGHLGLPVKVDSGVVGSVNGDFQGTAQDIYRDVEKAFQLTMYYDNSKVYIYSSDQVSRKIIPMSETLGKMVLRNAKKMRVGDSLNKAVWSDMGLVVSGTQRYREQIDSYTRAIRNRTAVPDAKPEPRAEIIKVFKLKYAWADDTTIISGGQELLVRGVATLLRTVVESGMVGVEQNQSVQRSRLPRTEQGLRGRGLQSVGQSSNENTDAKAKLAEQALAARTSDRSTENYQSARNMSQTSIVADPLNNAVIIRDRPERMQNYQDLIDVLDVEPRMVEIEATIIDMDTDRLRSLGIDWRIHNDGSDLLFGSAGATSGQLYSNPSSITDGLTGFTQNVLNNKALFLSRIRALEQQKAARIVSKPHVMTLANVEALLDTTSTFFIRVAGREEVDLFNVSVGTTMRVTPHVFERGGQSQIKLKIDIVDGNQASQEVDGIPVIDESTINTQAIINAGQSLLIGGLVREFKSTGVTKVPVLGNIPGLGALFRNTSKNTSRVERMFLITPRLNTQVAAGKRYSVPILSGSEAQILESGPSRLEPTLAGLASRDSAFPLEQSLPIGNARVGLTAPNQPLPDPSTYPDPFIGTDDAQQRSNGSSIRDRLWQNNPAGQSDPGIQAPAPQQRRPEFEPFQPVAPDDMMVKGPVTGTDPIGNATALQQEVQTSLDAPDSGVTPAIEPEWQEVRTATPVTPEPTLVKAAPQITRPTNQPARSGANDSFAVIAGTPSEPDNSLMPDEPMEGWSEVQTNRLRKTGNRAVMQRQTVMPDNAGWTEIK